MAADDAGESLKGLRNVINCPSCSLPFSSGQKAVVQEEIVQCTTFCSTGSVGEVQMVPT